MIEKIVKALEITFANPPVLLLIALAYGYATYDASVRHAADTADLKSKITTLERQSRAAKPKTEPAKPAARSDDGCGPFLFFC